MKKTDFTALIIYEDDDFIVINKPAFIATLGDRSTPDHTILQLAKAYHSKVQVCHRLDKTTSGALILAKHAEAYRTVCQQFEKREITKVYHALVEGIHHFKEELVSAPIDYTPRKGFAMVNSKGKVAATIFHTAKAFLGYTLVVCQPITGRMHQIRVHALHKKSPIVGDVQYGGKPFYLSALKKDYRLKKNTTEFPLIKRVALHAYNLKFRNLSGKDIFVEAPYAKDFMVLLKQLEKWGHS